MPYNENCMFVGIKGINAGHAKAAQLSIYRVTEAEEQLRLHR